MPKEYRNNVEIRALLYKLNLPIWKAADRLGMSETTALRHLRHELSEDDKKRWIKAIEEAADNENRLSE